MRTKYRTLVLNIGQYCTKHRTGREGRAHPGMYCARYERETLRERNQAKRGSNRRIVRAEVFWMNSSDTKKAPSMGTRGFKSAKHRAVCSSALPAYLTNGNNHAKAGYATSCAVATGTPCWPVVSDTSATRT